MIGAQIPPADVQSVYALIALITDPKKAKEWLDKVAAAKSDADKVLAEANSTFGAATAYREEGLRLSEKAAADLAAATALKNECDKRAKDLTSQTDDLLSKRAEFERTSAAASLELDNRARAVAAREAAITEREDAAHRIAEAAERKVREYDAKLADLRKITG